MVSDVMKTRNKVAVKNMEYTRYIGIRYALALLLFSNLNWLIALFLSKSVMFFIPLLLGSYLVLAVFEQIKVYSNHNLELKHTKRYFLAQGIINLLLLAGAFYSPFFQQAFPFMANTQQGLLGIGAVLVLGAVIAFISGRKLIKIEQQEDRLYKEVTKYKNSLKVSEKNGRKK